MSRLLREYPNLNDAFIAEVEKHNSRTAQQAEVVARYRAQAVDEPIQISAVEMEAYLAKWGAK